MDAASLDLESRGLWDSISGEGKAFVLSTRIVTGVTRIRLDRAALLASDFQADRFCGSVR